MLEEKQSNSANSKLQVLPKVQKARVMACPLCCGEWISLGGLSKCMKCGFISCAGCGDNPLFLNE